MPRLKTLAAEQARAVDPPCCPSRAKILTGKYTHNHQKCGAREFREEPAAWP